MQIKTTSRKIFAWTLCLSLSMVASNPHRVYGKAPSLSDYSSDDRREVIQLKIEELNAFLDQKSAELIELKANLESSIKLQERTSDGRLLLKTRQVLMATTIIVTVASIVNSYVQTQIRIRNLKLISEARTELRKDIGEAAKGSSLTPRAVENIEMAALSKFDAMTRAITESWVDRTFPGYERYTAKAPFFLPILLGVGAGIFIYKIKPSTEIEAKIALEDDEVSSLLNRIKLTIEAIEMLRTELDRKAELLERNQK
ncbi:MAG: hypothetical protein K1X29_06080 [Bdellovibrionales bacterium]|nr:hypothetical protein [Bdellovibrionales bacterium]